MIGEWEREKQRMGQAMTDPAVIIMDLRKKPNFEEMVDVVLADISQMLKLKNRAYGNSALEPLRIFSKADDVEQLNVRIDDKLSRIKRGAAAGEDVEIDLIGYLVIKQIAARLREG